MQSAYPIGRKDILIVHLSMEHSTKPNICNFDKSRIYVISFGFLVSQVNQKKTVNRTVI